MKNIGTFLSEVFQYYLPCATKDRKIAISKIEKNHLPSKNKTFKTCTKSLVLQELDRQKK